MEIFYVENKPVLSVEWEVTRGKTAVKEDFSRAEVWAFLTYRRGHNLSEWTHGNGGMQVLDATVNGAGNISFTIPTESLDIGIYGVKLIWIKDGTGVQALPELLATNKRCMSEVFDLFGISASQYADTNPNGNIKFTIKSSAATYGYDGLSSYERAVMLGKTTYSESEWLNWLVTGTNIRDSIIEEFPFEKGDKSVSAVMKSGFNMAASDGSHAGGLNCAALGTCSFTHGYALEANNNGEVAFGQYNESYKSQARGYATAFTIGCGEEGYNANAFEVRQDGSIYVMLDGRKVNLQQYLSAVDALLSESDIEELPEAEALVGKKNEAAFEPRLAGGDAYYYGSIGSWAGFPIS